MKKLLVFLLVFIVTASLCACGSEKSEVDAGDEGGINVEKELFDVEVTLPALFFSGSTPEEIVAAANEKGFKECTVNENGSVTYKMSKSQHQELLEEVETGIEESISEILNDETMYQSFIEIKHTDDMSQFDVMVDGNSYGLFDSLAALMFYIDGAMYQTLEGKNPDSVDVIINFIDVNTNEILDTASYRDWVSGQ